MRKKFVTFAFICNFLIMAANAQQDLILKNKKGKTILPQKGDFALGIGTNSIFSYVGNLFSSSGNNNLRLDLLNDNTIFGKYFISSKSAIRLKFNIDQSYSSIEHLVVNDLDNTKMVTDKLNSSRTFFNVTVGYERRKGGTRLQVFYGSELIFNVANSNNKFIYGNNFSSSNTEPTSTSDFNLNHSQSNKTTLRPTESTQNYVGLGLRVFTGLEYFIFPKISIGGEIGLGYTNYFSGKEKFNFDSWDFVNSKVQSINNETNGNSSSLKTDNLNGQIFIMFHF